MACSSCAERAKAKKRVEASQNTNDVPRVYASSNVPKTTVAKVVKATETGEKVTLRYYGGGSGTVKTRGCRSCGGGGVKYSTITSERIMFASEDAPNGYFNLLVSVGHDYTVTRNQADYMLTLTYQNKAGQTVHKFREV